MSRWKILKEALVNGGGRVTVEKHEKLGGVLTVLYNGNNNILFIRACTDEDQDLLFNLMKTGSL